MNIRSLVGVLLANKRLMQNFTFVSILQLFLLLAPLITYPYLVQVLGLELYGRILTAQILVSYASLIIDFGSNGICAKHISQNRNNKEVLSKILSSVLAIRMFLFMICFIIYSIIIYVIPVYKEYSLLFILTYGLAFNEFLFPQYYFQGTENLKVVTIVSILIRILFISCVFLFVKSSEDYCLVPLLYSVGYLLCGLLSLFIIVRQDKIKLVLPDKETCSTIIKDASTIFATDIVCTIKDKLNYLLVGNFIGMQTVVIYDLGLKYNSLLTKPLNILCTIFLPRFAVNKSVKNAKKAIWISFLGTLSLVCIVNIFLEEITYFFLRQDVDLLPIRIFLIAPLLLSISSIIYHNVFVAWGYNKYALHSILTTTAVYCIGLFLFFSSGSLCSVYSFIALSLLSYLAEFIYRIIKAKQIFAKQNMKINSGGYETFKI